MTVNISCVAGAGYQFFDSNGEPLNAGNLYTYEAGSTTPASTYTSSDGLTLNSNPIILEADGRTPAEIWLTTGDIYKFVLKDSDNNQVGNDMDDIPGVNDFIAAAGLSTYLTTFLTTPPPIGSVTPSTGAFTTLSATSTVSGAGFTARFAAPGAIGSVTPSTGAFTTLAASGAVSGAGFIAYLASPGGPIGTTAPVGGGFTFAHTAPVAVTFHATAMAIDCALSNVFTTTFTANVTVAPALSNLKDGQTINWFITQDGGGSRTMTWPAAFKWPAGVAGVLSTPGSSVDLLVATYRSATGFWYATLTKAFA